MSFARERSYRRETSREISRDKKTDAEKPPEAPLLFVVSIAKQHVSLYGNGGALVATAPVSSGKPGHSTPTGIFSVLEKEIFHRSNLYSNAPMPFMQRVTWSGVAMHAGALPGYPASHGCVRLPYEFAKRLFGYTKGGERVVITRQDVTPVRFTSPRLPVATLLPLPLTENAPTAAGQVFQNALSVAAQPGPYVEKAEKLNVAVKAETQASAEAQLLNPIEFARIMHSKAAQKANEASAALRSARETLGLKSREAKSATSEVRKLNSTLYEVRARAEALNRRAMAARTDEAANKIATAKVAAEALMENVNERLNAAREASAEKALEAEKAAHAARDTELSSQSASLTMKSWRRRLEPLSVFISRRTSRLYIRQGTIKVFDVPVTIRDQAAPIGTHLFLAISPEPQAVGDNAALKWISLSVPSAEAEEGESGRRRGKRREREPQIDSERVPSDLTAASALERIDISPDVARKISEMVWTGASLIVSDNALSDETGGGTDFIILTR